MEPAADVPEQAEFVEATAPEPTSRPGSDGRGSQDPNTNTDPNTDTAILESLTSKRIYIDGLLLEYKKENT